MLKCYLIYIVLISQFFTTRSKANNIFGDTLTICCNQDYIIVDTPDTLSSFYEVDWLTKGGHLFISDSTLTIFELIVEEYRTIVR